jgi:hypothetical protein
MAVLSDDHPGFSVDGETPFLSLPLRQATVGAEIYYRGGLTWDSATGIIVTGSGDAAIFRGVVKERTNTVAANDRVQCYIYGHFKFNCANLTIANEGAFFRGTTADQDNPSTMVITAPGAGINGLVGMLTTAEVSATDGWVLVNAYLRDGV